MIPIATGESVLLVAPPKMGLTCFMVQWANKLAEEKEVVFHSYEMRLEALEELFIPPAYNIRIMASDKHSEHLHHIRRTSSKFHFLDGIDILNHKTLDPELAEIISEGISTVVCSCRIKKNRLGDERPLTRGSGLSRLFDTTVTFKRLVDSRDWQIEGECRSFKPFKMHMWFEYPRWKNL